MAIPRDLPPHLTTQSKFADMLGITQQRVSTAIKEGKIGQSAIEIFKGNAYVNIEEAKRQWAQNYTGRGNSSPLLAANLEPSSVAGLDDLSAEDKAAKLAALAKAARDEEAIHKSRITRIKAEEAENKLISRAEVNSALFELGREFRDKIMGIPVRQIPFIRSAKTDHQARIILEKALQDALEELSNLASRIENRGI